MLALTAHTGRAETCLSLTIVETNGTLNDRNLARATGATPFAKDLLSGWFPYHQIAFLNDGNYGNSNAWVSDSFNSFCGINFARRQQVSSIAFSRDNNEVFNDRSRGRYTFQWTAVPNPNEQTPDAAWNTIGAITNTVGTQARRQRICFPAVSATGIRILTQAAEVSPGGGGIAVDELEIYSGAPVLEIETAAVRVRWFGESNVTYQVQSSLNANTWSNLTTIVGCGAFTNIVDWTDGPRRFYRLVE
jgi:hypothetical protein